MNLDRNKAFDRLLRRLLNKPKHRFEREDMKRELLSMYNEIYDSRHDTPGIYLISDMKRNEVLYCGQSNGIFGRIGSHSDISIPAGHIWNYILKDIIDREKGGDYSNWHDSFERTRRHLKENICYQYVRINDRYKQLLFESYVIGVLCPKYNFLPEPPRLKDELEKEFGKGLIISIAEDFIPVQAVVTKIKHSKFDIIYYLVKVKAKSKKDRKISEFNLKFETLNSTLKHLRTIFKEEENK